MVQFSRVIELNKLFENYYFSYRNLVFSIAYDVLHDKYDAEDVVSDVFTKLYVHMLNCSEIRNVKPWLCTVARNQAYDYLNDKQHGSELSFDSVYSDNIDNHVFASEILNKLLKHNKQWFDVIGMHYVLGMSVKEIASELNCTSHSVRGNIHRAKKYLLNEYKENVYSFIILLIFLNCFKKKFI